MRHPAKLMEGDGSTRRCLCLLLLLALVGCGSRTNSANATVTLSTFSGRPNPTWQLEDEKVRLLRNIVNSLSPTDKAFNAGGLLPYAGFHVEVERWMIAGEARHLEVYDGVVLLRDKALGQLGRLEDPEYRVEAYLFETAERHVEPPVYDRAFDRFRELTTE